MKEERKNEIAGLILDELEKKHLNPSNKSFGLLVRALLRIRYTVEFGLDFQKITDFLRQSKNLHVGYKEAHRFIDELKRSIQKQV